MHDDIRPQLAEIVDKVERKAVVVVDQDNHARDRVLELDRHSARELANALRSL
jgi:hypothetical protein